MPKLLDIESMLEIIRTDPELEERKYARKDVISKIFGMKIGTLDDWIRDIKDNYPEENTVLNPSSKICLIHIDKFERYLIWKSNNRFKKIN